MTLLHSNIFPPPHPPTSLFKRATQVTIYYYSTLHIMIIILFEYVNDSLITHLFNTAWEVTGDHFEKALLAYPRQQQN